MMKIKHLSVAMSVFFALSGTCNATPLIAQGTIHFEGSIVEPGCRSDVTRNAAFELTTCPHVSRTQLVSVNQVDALDSSRHVTARLVANIDRGRYYDQRYELVDSAGKPIRSGMYLVTTTLP